MFVMLFLGSEPCSPLINFSYSTLSFVALPEHSKLGLSLAPRRIFSEYVVFSLSQVRAKLPFDFSAILLLFLTIQGPSPAPYNRHEIFNWKKYRVEPSSSNRLSTILIVLYLSGSEPSSPISTEHCSRSAVLPQVELRSLPPQVHPGSSNAPHKKCKGWPVFGDNQLFLIGLNLIRKADRMYWW